MRTDALYTEVTNSIIAQLEAGTAPWLQPWKNRKTGGIMPQNAATGRPYSGINILLLWAARDTLGYASNGWLTFKQAKDKGLFVRKGERSTTVVFTKKITVREEEEEKQIPILKTYYVFNTEQIDGWPVEVPPEITVHPNNAASDFVAATHAEIRDGGNKACFVPSLDFIALPYSWQFTSQDSYWATALHELGHWSGHETRLNRDLKNRFGSEAYAAEELIAELTSAFLCAHLGITGELRHADYIANWIKLLKEDERAIFTSASRASAAANYLRAFSEPHLSEGEDQTDRRGAEPGALNGQGRGPDPPGGGSS